MAKPRRAAPWVTPRGNWRTCKHCDRMFGSKRAEQMHRRHGVCSDPQRVSVVTPTGTWVLARHTDDRRGGRDVFFALFQRRR